MIAIIDYDAGNIKSVEKALLLLGEEVCITRDRDEILNADGIILPGVGAFGDAMEKLHSYGLVEVIKTAVDKKECISIRVITGMNQANKNISGTDYNYKFEEMAEGVKITQISSAVNRPIPNAEGKITDENYINPSGRFECEIKRDTNGMVVVLIFTQVL